MDYREHRKKLFEDEQFKKEYEKLLPEYELAKNIIEGQRKNNITLSETLR
jgi:hypothetical protein